LHALLLELYCHHNKLEDAVSTYAALVNTSDQTIDETKILKYATLLANNDRVQGKNYGGRGVIPYRVISDN